MLKEKVLDTIKKYNLLENNDKVVVRSFWRARLYLPCGYFVQFKKRGKNKFWNYSSTCKSYDKRRSGFRWGLC